MLLLLLSLSLAHISFFGAGRNATSTRAGTRTGARNWPGWFGAAVTTLAVAAATAAASPSPSPSSSPSPSTPLPDGSRDADNKDNWREWDMYRMLGLENPTEWNSRKRTPAPDYTDSDVRRAYRAQAKLHHPDKARRRTSASTSGSSSVADGKGDAGSFGEHEEANARFARIAEAYRILSDPSARKQYDRYLAARQMEQDRRSRTSHQDPRHHFEFYSSPYQLYDDDDKNYYDDFDDGGDDFAWWGTEGYAHPGDDVRCRYGTEWQQPQPPPQSQPDLRYQDRRRVGYGAKLPLDVLWVRDDREALVDARTGREEGVRIVTTLLSSTEGMLYRVAQDWVAAGWDHRALQPEYRSVAEPFLLDVSPIESVDSSYSSSPSSPSSWYPSFSFPSSSTWGPKHRRNHRTDDPGGGDRGDNDSGRVDYQTHPDYPDDPSLLWPNESLASGAYLERPPYVAVLVGCQLHVVEVESKADDDRGGEDGAYSLDPRVVWSSPPPVPQADRSFSVHEEQAKSCRLELRGSRLVVSSKSTGRVYWSSLSDRDGEDDGDDDRRSSGPSSSSYFARLDSDAALTVYRIHGIEKDAKTDSRTATSTSPSSKENWIGWRLIRLFHQLCRIVLQNQPLLLIIWPPPPSRAPSLPPPSSLPPLTSSFRRGFFSGPALLTMDPPDLRKSASPTGAARDARFETLGPFEAVWPWRLRCVHSTSGFGCLWAARVLVGACRTLRRWIRRIVRGWSSALAGLVDEALAFGIDDTTDDKDDYVYY